MYTEGGSSIAEKVLRDEESGIDRGVEGSGDLESDGFRGASGGYQIKACVERSPRRRKMVHAALTPNSYFPKGVSARRVQMTPNSKCLTPQL